MSQNDDLQYFEKTKSKVRSEPDIKMLDRIAFAAKLHQLFGTHVVVTYSDRQIVDIPGIYQVLLNDAATEFVYVRMTSEVGILTRSFNGRLKFVPIGIDDVENHLPKELTLSYQFHEREYLARRIIELEHNIHQIKKLATL